jgi:hypothetical protein
LKYVASHRANQATLLDFDPIVNVHRPEISVASGALGNVIGDGIGRVMDGSSGRGRDGIVESIVGTVGGDKNVGEAIIGDSAGILIVDEPIAREPGLVRASADLAYINGA